MRKLQGLNQAQNAAEKTPAEQTSAQDTSSLASKAIDHREQHDVPSQHGEAATGSSLARGDTGPLKEKDVSESDAAHKYSDNPNLDGEQMKMLAEGDVAEAVRSGGGGGHKDQDSLTQDLDAKTKRHEEVLHERGERTGAEIEEEGKEDWTGKKADVEEALSGRGTKIVLASEE